METGLLLLVVVITVIVFLLLRQFWAWYWKINQLIKGQAETNKLLQKLVNLQSTGKSYGNVEGEVIVQNTTTGEIMGISAAEWEKLISENPNQKKYKRME